LSRRSLPATRPWICPARPALRYTARLPDLCLDVNCHRRNSSLFCQLCCGGAAVPGKLFPGAAATKGLGIGWQFPRSARHHWKWRLAPSPKAVQLSAESASPDTWRLKCLDNHGKLQRSENRLDRVLCQGISGASFVRACLCHDRARRPELRRSPGAAAAGRCLPGGAAAPPGLLSCINSVAASDKPRSRSSDHG
jgi:hypothetical protein